MNNLKECFRCKNKKEICMFSINKKSKDGLYSYCNDCRKQYRKDNIEKIKERDIIYSKSDAFKESQKKYKSENKDKINVTRRKYRKNVLVKDPLFILKSAIRDAIRNRLKAKNVKKTSKTEDILGCSFENFKQYIESLWSNPNNLDQNGNVWMNWDNYGNPKDGIFEPHKTWDFDHIIPNSFGVTEKEVLKLNHYTNYQPMCSYFNRFIKKNNIIF
jgi:hypothetical protein